jgi:hypothetical protein
LALTIAALNSSASAQVASYQLDATLCQDVAGVNPNYDTRLPAAAAGAADPMRKRTLTGLDSVCNDGSPAVFYMRPAPAGSPNANKWVIFFDGGGGCASEDDCLERFCSLSGEWIDVAGKMSSLGAPAAIDPPTGLLARVAGNRFGNWNHVLVHYCDSSDYVGSAANKQLDPPSFPGRDYEIEFNGEAIFNDVFATLTSGPTLPDQGPESCYLPDLKNAFVLLGGESAAVTGIRSHVDRIAAELLAHNVTVESVTDASFGPALYDPALVWDPLLSGYASYDELGLNFSTPRWRDFWEVDDSAMDQSCLGSGVADYFCMDSVYLALNEVTTPSFVHADLVDSMGDEKLLDWGLYANRYDIAAATAAQFGTLPLGWGSFGQHCRQHVQIQRRQFNRTTINGGTGWTFHDVLWSWLTGGAVTNDIQGDNGAAPYTTSLLCN